MLTCGSLGFWGNGVELAKQEKQMEMSSFKVMVQESVL